MIKISIEESYQITSSGEVDYYTDKKISKTIKFLGIPIYKYSIKTTGDIPENNNNNKKVGFGK